MNEYELYHYGILGMKWGVRRYQNSDGTLTEAGRKHYQKKVDKMEKLLDEHEKYRSKASKYSNKIYNIRSRPRLTEFHDAAERRAMRKEAKAIKKKREAHSNYQKITQNLLDELGEKTLRELNPKYNERLNSIERYEQATDKAFKALRKKGIVLKDNFDSATEDAYWREFYDELDYQLGNK